MLNRIKFNATLFLLVVLPVFANAELPEYPMVFIGSVNVNGTPLSAGSSVYAYYGNTLAGEVQVSEPGVYGNSLSVGKKLLVGSGDGEITFAMKTGSENGGNETRGVEPLTYPSFDSGGVHELNLSFVVPRQSGTTGSVPKRKASIVASPTNTPVKEVLGATTYVFSLDLGPGALGDEVTALQDFLRTKGFFPLDVSTGYFGATTKDALVKYQLSRGLPATGWFGKMTRAKIQEEDESASKTVARLSTVISLRLELVRILGSSEYEKLITRLARAVGK